MALDPEEDQETPDDGDAETIAHLNEPSQITDSPIDYRVLETDVMGWGQHNAIIRVTTMYGESDYLATITEEDESCRSA